MADNVNLIFNITGNASKKLDEISKKGKDSLQNLDKGTKKASKGFTALGSALPIAGFASMAGAVLLLGKGVSSVVSTTAQFEQSMANLKAITKPTEDGFGSLSDKARELGATTAFSAKEAADAFVELGKLGLKTNQIISASSAVLSLAAASGEDMASTAETMASTLGQFNLDANQSGRVADIMAKSFTDSALNLERFRETMKFAGPAAAASNVELETTTALMEILSKNAITGSIAGTGLKNIFIQMGSESSKLSKFLKELGVDGSATVEEKFKALNEAGLTFSETASLVGKIAATSTQVLITNADAIGKVEDSLRNATGAAEEMAEERLDTLTGDVKLLTSALSEMEIQLGKKTNPALRVLTQITTDLIDDLNKGEGVISGYGKSIAFLADKALKAIPGLGTLTILTRNLLGLIDDEADESDVDLMNTDTQIKGVEALTAAEKRRHAILRKINKLKKKDTTKKDNALASALGDGDSGGSSKKSLAGGIDIHAAAMALDAAKEDRLKSAQELEDAQTKILKKGQDDRRAAEDAEKAWKREQKQIEQQEAIDADAQEYAAKEEKRKKDLADYLTVEEKKKQAREQTAAHAINLAGALQSLHTAVTNNKLAAINQEGLSEEAANKKRKAVMEKRKKMELAMAIVNGASAAVTSFKSLGFPWGLIPMAASLATTGVQIGTIASQKFAEGGISGEGIVGGNRYNGDHIPTMMKSGEMAITREDQQGLFSAIKELRGGGGTQASNQPIIIQMEMAGQVVSQVVVDANDRNTRSKRPVGVSF